MRAGLLQAGLWPKQNHLLLSILSAFGLVIFLNWSILCLALPGLVKTIFGIESIFSRSVFSLLNTTFFAVMAGLTYLCVDPILKACYALRCFYGQSRRSGEDLKAELKQQSLFAAKAAAYLALALMVFPQSRLQAADSRKVSAPFPLTPALSLGEREKSYTALEDLAASSSQVVPASPSPEELDQTIQTVLQQQKYTWRMPREKLEQPDADKGLLGRFLERLRQWVRSLRDWI